MKQTALIVLAGAAVFAGVFGGLRADRAMQASRDRGEVLDLTTTNVRPIQYDASAAQPFDFRAAAKKVSPSVVSVDRYDRVQRDIFDEVGADAKTGSGSGVVLTKAGIIVTNNHVVERADKVNVRFSDGRTLTARVLGTDSRSDLAVLKVEAANLTPIEVGASKEVQVGQWVLAVGNPLGFDNTVSVGVVSSLKRSLPVGGSGLVDAIQTDAAINPGNSGGALTDAQGRLIGINSAIASGTGQSVGIGFSIPVDRVRKVVDDIVKFGSARYAGLGLGYVPAPVSDYRVQRYLANRVTSENVPDSGVLVDSVEGNARKAGIQPMDVLLSIDGQPVEGGFDLNRILTPKRAGDVVTVKLWSKGQVKTVKVTLVEIAQQG